MLSLLVTEKSLFCFVPILALNLPSIWLLKPWVKDLQYKNFFGLNTTVIYSSPKPEIYTFTSTWWSGVLFACSTSWPWPFLWPRRWRSTPGLGWRFTAGLWFWRPCWGWTGARFGWRGSRTSFRTYGIVFNFIIHWNVCANHPKCVIFLSFTIKILTGQVLLGNCFSV